MYVRMYICAFVRMTMHKHCANNCSKKSSDRDVLASWWDHLGPSTVLLCDYLVVEVDFVQTCLNKNVVQDFMKLIKGE